MSQGGGTSVWNGTNWVIVPSGKDGAVSGSLVINSDTPSAALRVNQSYDGENAMVIAASAAVDNAIEVLRGNVTLANDPTQPMHAMTLQFADANYAASDTGTGAFLPLTGGTLTGPLELPNGTLGAPSLAIGAADGTGFSRGANVIVLSVQGVLCASFFGTPVEAAQFYGPVFMLNNRIEQVADATAAADALNLRTADARYAPIALADEIAALRAEIQALRHA